MKNKRKAKRILAGLLAFQLVFFVGVGTYVQNVYAEETVKSQTEEKEYPEKTTKIKWKRIRQKLKIIRMKGFWKILVNKRNKR